MKLIYRAATSDGKMTTGVIDAKDARDAASYLRRQQLIPIKIEVQKGAKLFSFGAKLGSSDVIFFTQQLSSMLTSGLTLVQSLYILKNQVKKQAMVEVLDHVIADVEEGETFSEALLRYPDVFSPIYIALVKAAETSGLMDKVMLRLAESLDKSQRLKQTIRGTLLYPAIVLSLMVAVIGVIMVFVVPTLAKYYDSFHAKLPFITRVLVAVSNASTHFWWLAILIVFGIIYALRRWHQTLPGRLALDNLVLKMPIFGKLITNSILTEFSRTFGLLIGTGAQVVEALHKTANIVGNIHFHDAIEGVATRVEKGITIGNAMSYTQRFPSLMIEMVKIGEQTGKLDESLSRASEYFERETEKTVKLLTTALEPLVMIVLGLGTAFLLIAILTPIFNLSNLF